MKDNPIISLESGIVYRNPRPHVKSIQAYFPSVAVLSDGEILVSLVTGEAFESVNLDTNVVRSVDGGETWSDPQSMLPPKDKQLASNCGRLTVIMGGEVVSMVVKSRRESYPEEGLANPENIGFVPTDLLFMKSVDNGQTWLNPVAVKPPLDGPSFEACSAIVPLNDGRWLWPTSTWRSWDGREPNGMKMIALVSKDQGRTWPEYLTIMDGSAENVINWEGKVVELADGRLLAISWVFDEKNAVDRPNHFAVSEDGGDNWTLPVSTGLLGQTMAIIQLPDGRLASIYRRMDEPGLWFNLSRLKGNEWINESAACLWGGAQFELNARSDDMVQNFNELKFGAPYLTLLPDNSIFIVFWCYEKMVSNIRWIKLRI